MLRILIEHNAGRGYLIDVECSKPVRHMGSNILGSHIDILDMVDEVIYDYREDR